MCVRVPLRVLFIRAPYYTGELKRDSNLGNYPCTKEKDLTASPGSSLFWGVRARDLRRQGLNHSRAPKKPSARLGIRKIAPNLVFPKPPNPKPLGFRVWDRGFREGSGRHGAVSFPETLSPKPSTPKPYTHRPLSSSFMGLSYRILNINHKRELLRGLWVSPKAVQV